MVLYIFIGYDVLTETVSVSESDTSALLQIPDSASGSLPNVPELGIEPAPT